jgi:hypothetical protein
MCIKNVYAQAKGGSRRIPCPNLDAQCLCDYPDFWYGLRDCSREGCSARVYEEVADWKDFTLCGAPPVVEIPPAKGPPTVTTITTTATATKTKGTTVTSGKTVPLFLSEPKPSYYTYEEGGKLTTATIY